MDIQGGGDQMTAFVRGMVWGGQLRDGCSTLNSVA